MDMLTIINSVLSLFVIMLVGVYSSKKRIITNDINKGLTDILLKITLPFLIISSFIITYDESVKSNVIKAFMYSLVTFIFIGIVSYLVLIPIKKDKKIILQFSNVFTNTGYIGFPILNAVYGSEGILYGSIFQIFYTIFI
ncbi:AEC family transporter, partial [Serpentinicella alkaliphila]